MDIFILIHTAFSNRVYCSFIPCIRCLLVFICVAIFLESFDFSSIEINSTSASSPSTCATCTGSSNATSCALQYVYCRESLSVTTARSGFKTYTITFRPKYYYPNIVMSHSDLPFCHADVVPVALTDSRYFRNAHVCDPKLVLPSAIKPRLFWYRAHDAS